MTQLLRGLIGNAIKFQPHEGPVVRIAARHGAHEWVMSVQDEGIGIDSQYQQRIFQMFQRLHSPDDYEGDGIGLTMAEKIVRIHGGKLWVESGPEKGSTFYFSIPEYSAGTAEDRRGWGLNATAIAPKFLAPARWHKPENPV